MGANNQLVPIRMELVPDDFVEFAAVRQA